MIDLALKIAKRSTHAKHQTGCVIVKRNKRQDILSNGWSHTGNWNYGTGLYSVHAEIHALVRGRHLDLTNSIVYIATKARKSGNVTNAAPCLTCAMALAASGIEICYYSINEEFGGYTIEGISLKKAIESANLKVYKFKDE